MDATKATPPPTVPSVKTSNQPKPSHRAAHATHAETAADTIPAT
jgi:hypothetical protein